MKDTYNIWSRVLRRSYSAVNTNNNAANRVREESNLDDLSETPPNKTSFMVGLIGLISIAIGMLVMFIHPYDMIFKMKVIFSDGGEVFEMWRNPPVDLYLRVHLFNITNSEAFLRGEEKMVVEEVGPYVYKEAMSHQNVTFNDNGTVTATPKHPLEWVPELSTGHHETDVLYLPHIALLSIADVVSKRSYFTKFGLNLVIRQTNTQPIVPMSPKEFMFGYESALMTLGYQFLPAWIDFHKLGLIDRMYNFEGDYETVYTGTEDETKGGLLDTYRGSTHIPQWEGYCGNIQYASDGTKFPSRIQPNDTLHFFRKSLCRAKPMVKVNETVSSGLKGYVYKFPPNDNDNGVYDEKNKCFCKTKTCLPPGLHDVRECYYGFPIALSYPHFLDGDKALFEHVDGLKPDRRRHESYFVVQPESGLPLDLAVRYQINMAIGDIDSIANAEKFSNMIIPMLWTENRLYRLPEDLASRFHMYLAIFPLVETGFMYTMLALGTIFVLVSLYKFKKSKKRATLNVPWIDEEVAATMDRKISVYMPENRNNMSNKELEVYYNSLVAPLNQQLDAQHDDQEENHHIRDEDE